MNASPVCEGTSPYQIVEAEIKLVQIVIVIEIAALNSILHASTHS